MQYKHESLSGKERHALRRLLRNKWLFALSLLLFLTFATHMAGQYAGLSIAMKMLAYVFSAFIALYYGLRSSRPLRKDLHGGYKILVEKVIDNKISYLDDDPGLGARGLVSPYMKYLFNAGGTRYVPSKEVYEKAVTGDRFIIPTSPHYGMMFEIRLAHKHEQQI